MFNFFITKNMIYKRFGKVIDSTNFKDNPEASVNLYFLQNEKYFRKTESPWNIVFFSRLTQKVTKEQLNKIVKETHSFILKNNLKWSLNDTHSPLGFKESVMGTHFLWNGLSINNEFLQVIEDCGFVFTDEFVNKTLNILSGTVISKMDEEIKEYVYWDFKSCYNLFQTYLGNRFSPSDETKKLIESN